MRSNLVVERLLYLFNQNPGCHMQTLSLNAKNPLGYLVVPSGLLILGSFLLSSEGNDDVRFIVDRILGFAVSVLAIILSLVFILFIIRQNKGISYDNNLVYFNHTVTGTITIYRNEIEAIEPPAHNKQENIVIKVRDVQKVIARQKSWVSRVIMRYNYNQAKGPVVLNAGSFSKDGMQQLMDILTSHLKP